MNSPHLDGLKYVLCRIHGRPSLIPTYFCFGFLKRIQRITLASFNVDQPALARCIFICRVKATKGIIRAVVKDWELIADNLHDAGWSLGWVSALNLEGRKIWIVDAHGYGKRFIVRADEILTAFVSVFCGKLPLCRQK